MSTKPAADIDLDDIENTTDTEVASEPPEEVWDGRGVKVRLEHPLVRNHQITGKGEPCLDCMHASGREDRSHQFHLRTSKTHGVWRGPDGEHMQALVDLGYVTGTPEARDRAQRQVEVDLLRGANGSKDRPQGFPEYVPLTVQHLKSQWRDVLKGGVEGIKNIEKAQVREEAALLRAAVKEGLGEGFEPLIAALKEALSGRAKT